ncbi:MAG TPA: sigma-70 family RNA polymerase sigma factor [Solirubrobacteraceae bacterium]|jgi:RNA polymerase sigma factor (sigma-70 family)|nr:sigma-70 family RNA polymerase sigma factor [Solirubrobacteraceae bacterium]
MSPRISIRLLAAQSDRRLAGLAGEGHERAFEALVQRYRRPLLRYCTRMRLSDARAEDVLQQAFLQAWMAFARGADVRDVRPWLYRIVHNVAVNSLRGGGDGHRELTDAAQAQASLAGESNLQRAMDVHDALAGVAALPQMQQQAIFLTAVDGQSHDEVATVLGISEGAVRGLLYRARTTLRSAAAALTPPQLIEWAAGGGGAAAPTAERIAELSAGGGAAGLGGLLLKGAVVAVTAGAVATGATVASSDGQGAKPSAHHHSHAAAPAGAAVTADRAVGSNDTPALMNSPGHEGSRGRSESGRRHGRGRGERSHDGHARSGSGDDRQVAAVVDDGSRGGPSAPSGSGSGDSGDGRGGSSSGSDGSGGGTGSGASGKGGQHSGSGSSGGGSERSGGGDVQSTPEAAPASEPPVAAPVAQPTTTSGSGSDDASATAGASSGGGSSGSGSGSGTKGGSGSDG